jgi:hypothetical protein
MKQVAASLLLGLLASGADAQLVYRCGSEYSQTPCAQGRLVDAADPRTAEQYADARRVAADDRRRADDMERKRLAEEGRLRSAAAGPVGVRTPARTKPRSMADASPSTKTNKRASAKPVSSTRTLPVVAITRDQTGLQRGVRPPPSARPAPPAAGDGTWPTASLSIRRAPG